MKLALSTVSICRTPIFSIQEELKNVWNELKKYIQESSPEFYEVIKNHDYAQLLQSDQKLQFTVWKYFNRAKFRATPYGNFAAFSLVPISQDSQPAPIILEEQPIVHRFPNWKEQENINPDPKWLLAHASLIRANTSAYRCGDELRYMSIEEGLFELSATSLESTMSSTLHFCHTQRSINEVLHFLHHQHAITKPVAHYFLQQLVFFQLLITDFQPNIIGSDYFKRINYQHSEKTDDYIIAERKTSSGELSAKNLQVLIELTNFLNAHLTPVKSTALQTFKANFQKKYEHKKVPLLTAMDPEVGLGYRSLTQDKEEDELIKELKLHQQSTETAIRSLNYPPIYQFILDGMLAHEHIDLSTYKEPANPKKTALANTISILLYPSDQLLIIAQIGGCTANSLLGRFTMASDELINVGQQFSALEHSANPGVLFFDVAYQIEKHADNINRRRSIYPYELPILSWSESGHLVDPDDIMVSVQEDEIILQSVKYGQRVVPKLASAYNYGRSDLSIYRFLSDLQYQNLHASLTINTADILPGLSHYQRIQYKNIVLSTEKWLVPQEICTMVNREAASIALQQWLATIKLTKPFKAGFADQMLIFNPQHQEDLHAFLLFCKQKSQLYIEETFIPEQALVCDEENNPYWSEFIVNLSHQENLYAPKPLKEPVARQKITVTDSYLPGSEWLYFEIYCHSSNSDRLLLYIAKNYLHLHQAKLKNWFFIRYNDPAYHIRLRLNLKVISDLGTLISSLSELLSNQLATGIVSDLQIKTYRRENDRYGTESINLAEKCFGTDSKFILFLLKKPIPNYSFEHLSVALVENVMTGMQLDLQEQLSFVEKMADSFAREMNIAPEGFKKINIGYKYFAAASTTFTLTRTQNQKIGQTAKSFLRAINANTETTQWRMLADLFHMHINRFFSQDQRMHELIIYHYLTKRLKMKVARLRQMP